MPLRTLRQRFLLTLLVALVAGEPGDAPRLQAARRRAQVVRAQSGARASLACTATGRPPPDVAWLTSDFALLPPDPRWRVLENGTLLLEPAAWPSLVRDAPAAVRCRATNLHGAVVSPPIFLWPVRDERSVTVAASAVQAGGVAALRCAGADTRATGAGASTVAWWRNHSPLLLTAPTPNAQYVTAGQNGEWLLFDGSMSGDSFSCQIMGTTRSPSTLLQITENVSNEMPRLALSETDVHVLAGTDVCLPCAAPDHPPPHYTWYRESGGRLQAAGEAGAWAWRGGAALCFSRVSAAAAGAWLCRASTARGDATARARLLVGPPLTVTLTPEVTVAGGGDTVRLECQISNPEAAVTWMHMGAPAALTGDVTALGGGVLLLRVTSRTRGLWQCEARHGFDIEQATAEIRLAEAAPELRYTFIEQALRAGARVSLRCAAAGAPPPRFSWRRDDVPLQSVSASHRYLISEERVAAGETVSTVNISAVAPEDGGRYSCRAVNRLGYADHSARLNIHGPPMVRSTPPQRALAGENVTLFCPYAGYPISSVTWRRSGSGDGSAGGVVGASGEGRVAARGAALLLRPALASDAGRYTCRVAAPGGAAAAGDVALLVLNPPKISPFIFSPDLSEGNSVRVICSVSSGDRPISFSWLKDGTPLAPELQIEETSLDDFSLLKFKELTERHSGDYTCRVTNPAASVDYTTTLHVKVPPTWTREPLDTAVAVGAPLRVECVARGEPAPRVAWHRRQPCGAAACEWRALAANGTLWAPAAPRDLGGLYRCSADNGVGPPLQKHVNVTIFEPAQIESSNEIVNVTCVHASTAVCTLTCVARGDEPLTVTWSRASTRGLNLHSGRLAVAETRVGDSALRSELAVRAVTAADAGEYHCRAVNTRGHSQRIFLLHVEEPPSAPSELRVRGRGARRVRLSWRGARSLRYSALLERLRAQLPRPPDLRDLRLDESSLLESRCEAGWSCAVLAGLQPGAAYSVRLRATSRAGQSPLSEPLMFTTLEDAPSSTPQDVRVKSDGAGELHVAWSPPAQATWNGELLGYAVSWRAVVARGGADATAAAGHAVRRGGTSLVLSSLRPGQQYSVTVRAFNRAGVGPLSSPVLAFTSGGEPETPTNVRCVGVSARELRVLWTPDPTHQQYELLYAPAFPDTLVWTEVEESASGGWRARVSAAAGGAGAARLSALRPGTRYGVWLRARTGPAAPPAVCSTADAAAGAVSEVWARGVSANAVRVWWRAPAAGTGAPPAHYTLHARDLSSSEGEWVQRVVGGEEQPAHVVAGLRARARYEFWVRAHAPAGAGASSPRVLATPQPPALTDAVRIWSFPRAVVAAVGARVRLPCAADGAPQLRRRWTPLPPHHAVTADGHLDILGVQLEWAGNYTCSVRNAMGADSVTHTLRTRPAPEPPPAPASPRLTRATLHELYLTWDSLDATIFPPLLGYTIEWNRVSVEAEGSVEARDAGETAALAGTAAGALRGLACGARYRVRLRAHNARGSGAPSPDLLATTAGYEPVPAAAGEFIWANSSALRLNLLAWDAPCDVLAWRVALRPAPARTPAGAWRELRVPDTQDDLIEVGELIAECWYEVRVTARWSGGAVAALYRAATLTADGERVGESERLPAEERAVGDEGGGEGALLPAALATALALSTVIFVLLVCRVLWRWLSCGPASTRAPPGLPGLPGLPGPRGPPSPPAPRARDQLPPLPAPIHPLDYALPSKCDVSDIRIVSARLSSAGSVSAGACDSASDSSGEPCAACQRAAAAAAAATKRSRAPPPRAPPPPRAHVAAAAGRLNAATLAPPK